MTKIRLYLVLLLGLLLTSLATHAQTLDFTIDYGETQSAIFEGEEFSHRWIFFGDAGDILNIRAFRIAGQFTPRVLLLDAAGEVIAESSGTQFTDYDELILRQGLPTSEFGNFGIPFQIEVRGIDILSNERDNPAEYSLSLERTGRRLEDPSAGLAPLPDTSEASIPELETGESTRPSDLGFDFYGAVPDVVQSNTANIPVRFLASTSQWELAVNNAVPASRGVVSATFTNRGIGLVLLNDRLNNRDVPTTFFSDENFMVAYDSNRREYTFTTNSGTTIITDFFQLQDIQFYQGVVIVRVNTDGRARSFLFNGERVDIRRLAGGDGTEEAIVQMSLENEQSIVTDLASYETLAYLNGQLRVLYGNGARFISNRVRLDLRQDNTDSEQYEIVVLVPNTDGNGTHPLTMRVDWRRMGDIRVEDENLIIEPFDNRQLVEPLVNLDTLDLIDGGARFSRIDGTSRTSFPDGTDIETVAVLTDDTTLLPYQEGFRSRNHNNLGEHFIPLCPCVNEFLENQPVNPANGNFFYSVTDFYIPSHTLELNLTRYYNSQGMTLTPAYMVDAPLGYDLGQFGGGWRHSYQYELDISDVPLGRIRLIMPSGAQHLFFPDAEGTVWTSRTLISWQIERMSELGRWQAVATSGERYYFDRAGRLERISETPSRSVTLSPLPQTYINGETTGGVFITDPYGRRLELYAAEAGRILYARDTSARQIRYNYDENGYLAGVEYITPTQTASYEYDETGALIRIFDARSPYSADLLIEYDSLRRVARYHQNPDGLLSRDDRYTYEGDGNNRVTTQSTRVNGQQRQISWTYNNLYQLTRRTTPREGYDYEFTYDANSGLLTSYRTPTFVRYTTTFSQRGNLTRFEDPFFTGDRAYNFTYEQRGNRSLLTRITYPNGADDNFIWSEGDDPQLLMHRQLVLVGTERISRETRFEYDEWGRLVLLVEPGNIGTVYNYDSFGYVESVWEGIELAEDETRADIGSNQRALRVLRYDYDLMGQVRAVTDGRGQTYTLNWDSSIEKLRQINGANDVSISYSYDARGRVALVNDRGQETQYTYNGLDQITGVIDAGGIVLTYDYDEAGNLLQIVDDAQRTTRFRYDELDNPIEMVSPRGLVTSFDTVVDIDFLIRREIDPAGRVITRRYDVLGRLRRYTLTDGDFEQEFRVTYNSVNQPTEIVEALSGRTLTLEYDLIGQVRAVNVAGSRTQFAYDPRGQLTSVTSPAGRVTNYTYDALGNIIGVTLPDESQLLYDYDANGNLLTATDAAGLTTTYVYNALNQLISIEDPAGLTESYDYDLRGNLTNIVNPNGINRTFTYDVLDNLVQATDGRGQATTYEYDDFGRLFNIQQPGVRSTRLTYDIENNIIAVTERPREQRTLYSYDVLGRISSITDPLGHTVSYSYNPVGRITREIDALGNEQRYTWRTGVQTLSRFTDAVGRSFDFNTDNLGRVTTIRDRITEQNVAINTQFTYDADGLIQGVQIGTDQARTSGVNDTFHQYEYSPIGLPVRYLDPSGGEWLIEYNASGYVTLVTNPLGVATRYERDNNGRILTVVNNVGTPEEVIENYSYDANGNITFYMNPDGVVNSYVYDQNDRLLQAVLAQGTDYESRHIFEYNALGQLIRTEDPNGTETRYFYSLDKLIRIEQDLGEESLAVTYNYDDAGNLRNIVFPGRNETTRAPITINMTYDALDRRVRFVNGEDNVWSYTYNAAGNVVQISDPLGSVVRYVYDNYDRVTQIIYPSGSGTANFSYDTAGNLRTVTLPPNNNGTQQPVTYVLDIAGNITEMRIGTQSTRYEYDVMGNLLRRVAPDGRVTTYAYDAANRLVSTSYDNGTVVNYSYDALGNLVTADGINFNYDLLGRITNETSGEFSNNYVYDAAGNLLVRQSGAFGIQSYIYDELYRPTIVDLDGESVQVVYDEMNQVRQLLRSNGVRSITSYDGAGRPITILHFGPNNERLDGFNYQYDAVGNLIRIDRVTDSWRVLYSYDVAHRLIDERWLDETGETEYAVSFRYDEAGNRIEELRNGRRTIFRYNDLNQLVEEVRDFNPQNDNFVFLPIGIGFVFLLLGRKRRRFLPVMLLVVFAGIVSAQTTPATTVRYEYDTNGNLTRIRYVETDTQLNLSYDAENRLVAVTGQDEFATEVDVEYTYDIMSRLVTWRNGTEIYTLVYDGHDLIGMADAEGNVFERYLNFNGERLLTMRDGDAIWHLNDQIGSPRRFADASGQLITDADRTFEFGSFGVRIYPYTNGEPPLLSQVDVPTGLFADHLYDPAANLYHMGLRSYHAETGRFLQLDPIRQDPIGTLYSYARNRPFMFTDSNGMTVDPFVDPTIAANLAQQLEPESLIPRPLEPMIPVSTDTQRLQADETFRAFEILEEVRYGTNGVVAQLSPMRDNFFLFEANPMPQELRDLQAQPLNNLMSIYHSGAGWLPDPRSNPAEQVNPFSILDDAQPILARAYVEPLVWQRSNEPVDTLILPTINVPTGLPEQMQRERGLWEYLQQVPLMTALVPEVEQLTALAILAPEPTLPNPSAAFPELRVEPPILNSLDTLREESYQLRVNIWSLGLEDCGDDCIPDLSFSR